MFEQLEIDTSVTTPKQPGPSEREKCHLDSAPDISILHPDIRNGYKMHRGGIAHNKDSSQWLHLDLIAGGMRFPTT
jgi:hypothetical protein